MSTAMNPFFTHGAVSWSEYLASDPAESTDFYRKLLGWRYTSMPMEMDGGGTYHVALVGDTNVSGLMKRPHSSIPPCWGFYVTVQDIHALVAEHSPQLFVPITNTPMGPFCGIQDPQGGMLHAIQYANPEAETQGVIDFASAFSRHGLFSWFELHTGDGAAAAEYYCNLFGWTIQEKTIPFGIYRMIMVGEVAIGGIAEFLPENTPPYWHGFITVDNVDDRTTLAATLGAVVNTPAFDLPGVGRMAHIQDPSGAPLTLITYESWGG